MCKLCTSFLLKLNKHMRFLLHVPLTKGFEVATLHFDFTRSDINNFAYLLIYEIIKYRYSFFVSISRKLR